MMKDFLGNEFGPGDKVLYAAHSGRAVTMVLAEVVSINEKYYDDNHYRWVNVPADRDIPVGADQRTTVTVQPLNSSRWKQHYGRTRYIDTRTGKGINPFSGNDKHMVGDYYERQADGHRAYRGDVDSYPEFPHFYTYYDWGAPDHTPEGWRFVKQEFKNYVKRVEKEPGPVTITVTENIVKWAGKTESKEQHPEWNACKK